MTDQGIEFARALGDKQPEYFSAALSVMTLTIARDFLADDLPLRTVQDLVVGFRDAARSEYTRIQSGLCISPAGKA
jgi:hypothetical protein